MAFGRLVIAYPMRYPNPCDELLSDPFFLALYDAVRRRHTMDHEMVYGGQLRHDVHCLLQHVSLLS